jgi:alditol oxidase
VKKVLPLIEEKLAPFGARPHWGKLFTMAPSQVMPQYAQLSSYQKLLAHYDAHGKFRNRFVNANIYGV